PVPRGTRGRDRPGDPRRPPPPAPLTVAAGRCAGAGPCRGLAHWRCPAGREGMFEPEYPIRTKPLLLRPYAPPHLHPGSPSQRLAGAPRYLDPGRGSRAEVEARVRGGAGAGALPGPGQPLNLVADLADTGQLVGDCVLFWHSQEHEQGEIGYTLNPAYH